MKNLETKLEYKIEQLFVNDSAKVADLFAESVRKFLTGQESINDLDLLKRYFNDEDVSECELANATHAPAVHAVMATAYGATVIASSAATTYGATAASTATVAAYTVAAVAVAAYIRLADPSITIESQIKIVDELLKDTIIN
jgi:hypothetical protein